ncbi:MAG: hypothetical protein QM652_09565 [Legionella sp.]|uniref:hypothetical protein n=1 Tax=Legionella sp. TaxID=459 RepID=UPI0039E28222
MSSNKAVILEHTTEVTSADSQGRAVSGHLDNSPFFMRQPEKNPICQTDICILHLKYECFLITLNTFKSICMKIHPRGTNTMHSNPPNDKSPHRVSPPRTPLKPGDKGLVAADKGINPETSKNDRTLELATDQSIAARHLLYHPNATTLAVVNRCADGVGSVMARLAHTGNKDGDLAKDEILINMVSRLMADGSTGRIIGFNQEVDELMKMKKTSPTPPEYAERAEKLANKCRENMAHITATAKIPGPDGALARQGLLAFMGDLGGLEKTETGFGLAFKGPIGNEDPDPKIAAKIASKHVYDAYVAGLCDAQRKLNGQGPASPEEVSKFEVEFAAARAATSVKGGVLSAPAHTAAKKAERAPVTWDVRVREGLLDQGNKAEDRLKKAYPDHKKTLVDAAWPGYLVSPEVTKNVVEPVTGHVSGTFGEMAVTMNLFCGTPPKTMTREDPSGLGNSKNEAQQIQASAIAALSGAGLITAGFHSAVEMFQPMSTFTTQATTGALGPKAVEDTITHAKALEAYANHLDNSSDRSAFTYTRTVTPPPPLQPYQDTYKLTSHELNLDKDHLMAKSQSLADVATKSVDMISVLQGEGGTIATLDVSRIMANHSTDPQVPAKLYSVTTRLEELGQGGYTPALKLARDLIESPLRNEKTQEKLLEFAVKAAELTAIHKDKNLIASKAKEEASRLEIMAVDKESAFDKTNKERDRILSIGWGTTGNYSAKDRAEARELSEKFDAVWMSVRKEAISSRKEAEYSKETQIKAQEIADKAEEASIDAQTEVLDIEIVERQKAANQSPHRVSPPRTPLKPGDKGLVAADKGINPETSKNDRTLELATDQSIAARHLLYHPNATTLAVVNRCADGVGSVMARLAHTGNKDGDLAKDEILINMVSRLMADGSTGRIIGFNQEVDELMKMKKTSPTPPEYAERAEKLANKCRENMAHITATAKIPGPDGALARQGLLAFMGDLGGLEKTETGFGLAFKGPIGNEDPDPKIAAKIASKHVYDAYVAGLCDAQRKLNGQGPASPEEVSKFEVEFAAARAATSVKGGVLSAPAHTAAKKAERAPVTWDVRVREGLLDQGNKAEDRLKKAYPDHKKTLVDAAWPGYLVSPEVTKNVVEPVTGHVSGTFGEMAVTMNLFCGTPPSSVSRHNPAGDSIPSADKNQLTAIAALSGAGLITAGFHSAVEIFQPMSTLTTQATTGALGPEAVESTLMHAEALRAFVTHLDNGGDRSTFVHTKTVTPPDPFKPYQLTCTLNEEELQLSKENLMDKALSLEDAATKSVDMISLLQGEGGTIATLDVSRVMANHSTNPDMVFQEYSLNTRLDELGQKGSTNALKKARELAQSPDTSKELLELAIEAAEWAFESKEMHERALRADKEASRLETIAADKEAAFDKTNKERDNLLTIGWGATGNYSAKDRAEAREKSDAFNKVWTLARSEAIAARKEATAAKQQANEAHSLDNEHAVETRKAVLRVSEVENDELIAPRRSAELDNVAELDIEEPKVHQKVETEPVVKVDMERFKQAVKNPTSQEENENSNSFKPS